ncbi:hypothetical protein FOZ60_014301 [Perkinsus olseni]|uniref:Uncharacterized protein n=2 Tax=Perkinsus olseni TaxID=32597 RepID=A0A7J6N7S7_PEROL|nr:hypothetical protein FOZ60_014301 [Perkinsus olseni]
MTPSSAPPPPEEWTFESVQAGWVPRDVRQGLPPLLGNPTEQQVIRRMRAIEERMALLSRVESVSRQLDHLNVRASSSRPTSPSSTDTTPAPGVIRWGKGVRPGWQDPRSLVERMNDPVGPEDWIQWDNGVYAVAGERRDYSIAEVDELNRVANAGPHPEDRYGPESYDVPLPPQQPKPHFDWDIDSAIARSGLRHPGWTEPSPFVPKSRTWDSICLRGSEREGCGWLRQSPTAIAPQDFANHEWNEYWQTFGDTECSSRVLRSQVIFEDLKVAGIVSSLDEDCAGRCLLLSGLSAGPYRNVSHGESPYPPPYIPAASAILRWLHSADVPAMSVTIHCEHGHRYGEPRSECTVLLCCSRHVQLSVHRIMRLSRERPLRPRAYTFVARSDRTFELNLWDRRGRRSGLDKPEALVDLLYKYEVAKNQRDDVPLPFTSFYRWPSFFRDIRPAEWLWAETYAYPYGSDQEYLSLNWIWKQTELDAGLEEIVYPLMEYYREVDSDTAPLTPKWSWHGPNA